MLIPWRLYSFLFGKVPFTRAILTLPWGFSTEAVGKHAPPRKESSRGAPEIHFHVRKPLKGPVKRCKQSLMILMMTMMLIWFMIC